MQRSMRNYHTHTFRCKHASGDTIDYARAASERGMDVLGITDHVPLPDGRWQHVRMEMNELENYLQSIDEARRACPEITLLKGMESEWIPEFRNYLQDEMLGRSGLDFMLGSVHWCPCDGDWVGLGDLDTARRLRCYAEHITEMMETGIFAFIGHPDGFGATPRRWNDDTKACARDILEAAQALGTLLEINGYGMRKKKIETPEGERWKYPWLPFWEMAAEYDIAVICNSDAHMPEDIDQGIAHGQALAERLGLKQQDLAVRLHASNSTA